MGPRKDYKGMLPWASHATMPRDFVGHAADARRTTLHHHARLRDQMRTPVAFISAPDPLKSRYLAPLATLADIAQSADAAELKRILPGAEVILIGLLHEERVLAEVWPHARNVRWVHTLSAGVEGILFPGLLRSEALLTNSRGVFKRPLAEFALLGMLMHFRKVRTLLGQQREHRWAGIDVQMLQGQSHGRRRLRRNRPRMRPARPRAGHEDPGAPPPGESLQSGDAHGRARLWNE
jgi:hypothetical protein